MEILAALFLLGCLVVGLTALVCIIRPIPRIGFTTRKKAAGILVLSYVAALLSTAEFRPSWQLILFLLVVFWAVFWIFWLLKGGRRKKNSPKEDTTLSFRLTKSDGATVSPAQVPTEELVQSSLDSKKNLRKKSATVSKSSRGWIEPGVPVTVAGREVRGMVYLGSGASLDAILFT